MEGGPIISGRGKKGRNHLLLVAGWQTKTGRHRRPWGSSSQKVKTGLLKSNSLNECVRIATRRVERAQKSSDVEGPL